MGFFYLSCLKFIIFWGSICSLHSPRLSLPGQKWCEWVGGGCGQLACEIYFLGGPAHTFLKGCVFFFIKLQILPLKESSKLQVLAHQDPWTGFHLEFSHPSWKRTPAWLFQGFLLLWHCCGSSQTGVHPGDDSGTWRCLTTFIKPPFQVGRLRQRGRRGGKGRSCWR